MKERITRLYSWINAQDSFEVKDIGMQLLSLIEEQERRLTLLEGAKNTEQLLQPDNSCEHSFSPVYQCVHCGKIGDSIA